MILHGNLTHTKNGKLVFSYCLNGNLNDGTPDHTRGVLQRNCAPDHTQNITETSTAKKPYNDKEFWVSYGKIKDEDELTTMFKNYFGRECRLEVEASTYSFPEPGNKQNRIRGISLRMLDIKLT